MRETTGKKNNPHIYDICDQWSVMFAMYIKRRKVYNEGGFKIDQSNCKTDDSETPEKWKKPMFLS
jgi:hypothetical protein